MPSDLPNKRICIAHPGTVKNDFRLHKTIEMLTQAGANITVLCSSQMNSATYTFRKPNVTIFRADAANIKLPNPSQHTLRLARVIYNLIIYRWLLRRYNYKKKGSCPYSGFSSFISKGNFDCAHFINYQLSDEISRLSNESKTPIIYETYENWQEVLRSSSATNIEDSEKWLGKEAEVLASCKCAIVVSEPIASVYKKIVDKNNVHVIYNVAPNDPIFPKECGDKVKFLNQGYMRPNQGIEEAIAAFSKCTGNFSVTFQGRFLSQEYEEKVRELASSNNCSQIIFEDECAYIDVVSNANNYDVGFLTSPAYLAGKPDRNSMLALPNKLFTYAAAGLALVFGSHQLAIKEILKGFDCVQYADTLNEHSITEVFQCLIDNKDKVNDMKIASNKWAYKHSFASEKQKLLKVYEQCL